MHHQVCGVIFTENMDELRELQKIKYPQNPQAEARRLHGQSPRSAGVDSLVKCLTIGIWMIYLLKHP
jgi:hypothetical protein